MVQTLKKRAYLFCVVLARGTLQVVLSSRTNNRSIDRGSEGRGGAVIGRAIYHLCNVVKRAEHARGTPLVLYYVQEYAGYKNCSGSWGIAQRE